VLFCVYRKKDFFGFDSRENFWTVFLRWGKFFIFTADSAPLGSDHE
jgi:hypothetical protein